MINCEYNKSFLQKELERLQNEIRATQPDHLRLRLQIKSAILKSVIKSFGDKIEHCGWKLSENSRFCAFHDPDAIKGEPDQRLVRELERWIRERNEDDSVERITAIGFNVPVIRLESYTFTKPITFALTKFRKAEFLGTTFNKEADFWGAKFEEAYFPSAEFKKANFSNTEFGEAYFWGAKFEKADFRGIKLGVIVLRRIRVEDDATIFLGYIMFRDGDSRLILDGCRMNVLSFVDLPELEDPRRVQIRNPIFVESKGEVKMVDEKIFWNERPDDVLNVYRRLRKNLDSLMFYSLSGKLFVREMRLSRMRRPWYERPFYWAYDLLALYGESMIRPPIWMLATILGFALLLTLTQGATLKTFFSKYSANLLESTKNFFQIGEYRDFLSLIERLIALPIFGTWIIALKRKLERRIK